MNDLVSLTKVKGKGAGIQVTHLTQSTYLRAKEKGLLVDWILTNEIEVIEFINKEIEEKILLIDDVEPLFLDSFETQETLEVMTTNEIKEIMTSKKMTIPNGQVKKQVLIDLILNNQ